MYKGFLLDYIGKKVIARGQNGHEYQGTLGFVKNEIDQLEKMSKRALEGKK